MFDERQIKNAAPFCVPGLSSRLIFDSPLEAFSTEERDEMIIGPYRFAREKMQNKGTASHTEDVGITAYPFFGIGDATSEVYVGTPAHVHVDMLKDPVSLGQLASLCFRDCIRKSVPDSSLEELLALINMRVFEEFKRYGFPVERPAEIGGLAGVIGKFNLTDGLIEFKQWGDSLFIVEQIDGTVGYGINMLEKHEQEMLAKIAELTVKYNGDRSALWKEFAPFLKKKRAARINSSDPCSYPMLNGQPAFLDKAFDYRVPLDRVKRVLVFTDGLVRGRLENVSMDELANQLLAEHSRGGLRSIYEAAREREAMQHGGHIKHAEVTAIAFTFRFK